MLTRNPIWVSTLFLFANIYNIKTKGFKAHLLQLLYFIPMLIIIVAVNSYFNGLGLTLLFNLGQGNPITLENVMYGLFSALALFNVFLWFSCYNSLLTSDEILSVLGNKLPTIALALSMIIKYIPDTFRQGKEILLNQKSMLGRKKLNSKQKLHFAIRMLTILLSWSMENALETADSMKAKGYPSDQRISYSQSKFNKRDLRLIILILALLFLHLIFAINGPINFVYYPLLSWQGAFANPIRQSITFLSLAVILILPLTLSLFDWLAWIKIKKNERSTQKDIKSGIIFYEQL